MEEENIKKKNRFSLWLDGIDQKAEEKGSAIKTLWQIVKFLFVSGIVTVIQISLLYLMYFLLKGWTTPLPGFLSVIFSEATMGVGHSNWGYIFPFFASNLLANTVGYFINRYRTFKSDAPIWHYVLYIITLFIVIFFCTWLQGLINNLFVNLGVEFIAPTIAMLGAGAVQALILFPIQKFILLREKKE